MKLGTTRRAWVAPIATLALLTTVAAGTAGGASPASAAVSSSSSTLATFDQAVAAQGAVPATTQTDGAGVTTTLPNSGGGAGVATTSLGQLTMTSPATGTDLAPGDAATSLFAGSAPGTTVAVQSTSAGLRALVSIDSNVAPDRFDFTIGGDVVELRPALDGGVVAYDDLGNYVAAAPPPWAQAADGTPVPAHYEVDQRTLTLVVDHKAGAFTYPVVADPVWAAVAAAAAYCARGALGSVAIGALLDIYHGKASKFRTYVENAIVGCLSGGLGWGWQFVPGAVKKWLVTESLRVVIYVIRRVR